MTTTTLICGDRARLLFNDLDMPIRVGLCKVGVFMLDVCCLGLLLSTAVGG